MNANQNSFQKLIWIWVLQLGTAYWHTQHHKAAPNPPKSPASTHEFLPLKEPGAAQGVCAAHQNMFVGAEEHPQAGQASRNGAELLWSRCCCGWSSNPHHPRLWARLPWQPLFAGGACGGWFVFLFACLGVFFVVGRGGVVWFLLLFGVYFGCFVEPLEKRSSSSLSPRISMPFQSQTALEMLWKHTSQFSVIQPASSESSRRSIKARCAQFILQGHIWTPAGLWGYWESSTHHLKLGDVQVPKNLEKWKVFQTGN